MPGHAVNPQTGDVTLSTGPVGPAARDRLVTPAFIRLAVADLAYFTAAGVAIYALPLWVTGPVGSDKSGAGLAFGAFAVSALILRPVAGRLADTRGRRPLLVGGALISALGMIGTAYADNLVAGCAAAAAARSSRSRLLRRLARCARRPGTAESDRRGHELQLPRPLSRPGVRSSAWRAAGDLGRLHRRLVRRRCAIAHRRRGRGRDQERPVTLCADEPVTPG